MRLGTYNTKSSRVVTLSLVHQLPSSPRVHIVDMKKTRDCTPMTSTASVNCRKRHDTTDMSHRLASQSFHCHTASEHFSENSENMYRSSPLELRGRATPDRRLRKASVHSPVGVTPDKHFEKPTAFISPISRSMRKMPKSLHVRL